MDLKEFIKTALVDIVEGIEEARLTLDKKESYICPPMGPAYADKFGIQLNSFNGIYYQQAEFDVAVTVETKTDGGAKTSVKVLGLFKANIDGNVSSNNAAVSRIKFHVPLGLPSKRGYQRDSRENTR
jgi:hypothetical protein